METSGFWDNKDKANTTLKEKSSIERSLKDWGALANRLSDLEAMAELASEEGGESMHAELEHEIASVLNDIASAEIAALLSGEQDASNAILDPPRCGWNRSAGLGRDADANVPALG
jgi:peptide chain release factor 2